MKLTQQPQAGPRRLAALADIAGNYDIILSDIWGVVHNGVAAWPGAVKALTEARRSGKTVILITNSPRPNYNVEAQLAALNIGPDLYDGIVTSGDVTRALIEEGPRRLFHIGPERDISLFDGLDIELVEENEAQAVICTGLFADMAEDPEQYRPLLRKLRERNLPFICANPDIIVHIGDEELWCAGAVARIYTELGGRTLIAGKPHSPIYRRAFALTAKARGLKGEAELDKSRALVIGDGLLTDIKGGENEGLDSLFIAGGIHINDYGKKGEIDATRLAAFLQSQNTAATYFMPALA